ncbi:hypothetical protein BKA93DRAFT_730448 [Sparassis latifolia]
MLWAATSASGRPGFALWHLFLAVTTPALDRALQTEYGLQNPIYTHSVYWTPDMLECLATKYGIRVITVHQYPGQAVFIPAGCPHQVCNMVDAIKIACDFFSVENITHTQHLTKELHQQRLTSGSGDDVLQFYTTLWYT